MTDAPAAAGRAAVEASPPRSRKTTGAYSPIVLFDQPNVTGRADLRPLDACAPCAPPSPVGSCDGNRSRKVSTSPSPPRPLPPAEQSMPWGTVSLGLASCKKEIAWRARGAACRHARREDSEHKKLAAHTAAQAGKAGGQQARARNLVVPVDLRVAWFRDALVVAVELALALEVRAHIALTVELLQPHLLFLSATGVSDYRKTPLSPALLHIRSGWIRGWCGDGGGCDRARGRARTRACLWRKVLTAVCRLFACPEPLRLLAAAGTAATARQSMSAMPTLLRARLRRALNTAWLCALSTRTVFSILACNPLELSASKSSWQLPASALFRESACREMNRADRML